MNQCALHYNKAAICAGFNIWQTGLTLASLVYSFQYGSESDMSHCIIVIQSMILKNPHRRKTPTPTFTFKQLQPHFLNSYDIHLLLTE